MAASGCASDSPKPSPDKTHAKSYTIDELEKMYRNMEKRPEGYAPDGRRSISAQEKAFNKRLRKIFSEIDSYKHSIFVKDKQMAKQEKRQRHKAMIAKTREKEREASEYAATNKSLINAYY